MAPTNNSEQIIADSIATIASAYATRADVGGDDIVNLVANLRSVMSGGAISAPAPQKAETPTAAPVPERAAAPAATASVAPEPAKVSAASTPARAPKKEKPIAPLELDLLGQSIPEEVHSVAAQPAPQHVAATTTQKPAVAIADSVEGDKIYCLECGVPFRMLKRHLRTSHNLSEGGYRNKWGLADDYPLIAPNYSKQKSSLAKRMGFGKHDRVEQA